MRITPRPSRNADRACRKRLGSFIRLGGRHLPKTTSGHRASATSERMARTCAYFARFRNRSKAPIIYIMSTKVELGSPLGRNRHL